MREMDRTLGTWTDLMTFNSTIIISWKMNKFNLSIRCWQWVETIFEGEVFSPKNFKVQINQSVLFMVRNLLWLNYFYHYFSPNGIDPLKVLQSVWWVKSLLKKSTDRLLTLDYKLLFRNNFISLCYSKRYLEEDAFLHLR